MVSNARKEASSSTGLYVRMKAYRNRVRNGRREAASNSSSHSAGISFCAPGRASGEVCGFISILDCLPRAEGGSAGAFQAYHADARLVENQSPEGTSPQNRVGGGVAPAVLPHHRTYSSYPAVSLTVVTQGTWRRGLSDLDPETTGLTWPVAPRAYRPSATSPCRRRPSSKNDSWERPTAVES